MRARTFFWGLATIMLFVVANSYRQQQSTPETPTAASTLAGRTIPRKSSPPTTWPGISHAPQTSDVLTRASAAANTSTPLNARTEADAGTTADIRTDIRTVVSTVDHTGKVAVITAQDQNSQVNVRALPSQTADPLGYGMVGDVVQLGRAEESEDGHTWYYTTFQESSTVGWIRSDFLDIPPTPAAELVSTALPQRDVLKEALDEQCGSPDAIEAYFMTQNYINYLCKHRGKLLYLSQEKGTNQVIVSDKAQPVGGGYIVMNDNFEYRLDSSLFVVVRIDESDQENEILSESVIYSERY